MHPRNIERGDRGACMRWLAVFLVVVNVVVWEGASPPFGLETFRCLYSSLASVIERARLSANISSPYPLFVHQAGSACGTALKAAAHDQTSRPLINTAML